MAGMNVKDTGVKQNTEMQAIGLNFERWQDAVEAAIASDRLAVTGEVRGGQLIQFTDPSGAQLNILAVEPFATFIGFDAVTQGFAHVEMVNDVLALLEIIDPFGTTIAQATANLAQGPLLVDEPLQQWQQISLTAMGLDVRTYDSAAAYEAAEGEFPALFESAGAKVISSGSGAKVPTPAASFAARVMESEWRTNELTGEKFAHLVMDGLFPLTSACQWEPASCRRRTLSWPVPRCLRRLLSCPAAVAAMALAAVVAPVAAAAAATRTDIKAW